MSNAASIAIGNRIGAGEEERAYLWQEVPDPGAGLCGSNEGLLILSSNFFVSFYNVSMRFTCMRSGYL